MTWADQHEGARRPLAVMKFGGTSVADENCIRRVAAIVADAYAVTDLVVVVSAMAGITNDLIRAAECAERGEFYRSNEILGSVERRHMVAIEQLCTNDHHQSFLVETVHQLVKDGRRWCEITAASGNLSPCTRDAIASLGERLSCPLVAAALNAVGMPAEAIEGTELIVTDGFHGAAEPLMEQTRERSEARLRGLLQTGTIPIVTGFIGASQHGVLTTLGRGGSDYSATIMAAALAADEVTIWTDVDGIFTADPHLVPDARTIAEVSYSRAAELAHFGAKVLHPKTLCPVQKSGIPVVVRNSFNFEAAGTRIVPDDMRADPEAAAMALVHDATAISVTNRRSRTVGASLRRSARAADEIRAEVLLLACSPDAVTIVAASGQAQEIHQQLRREFSTQPGFEIRADGDVSVTTLVGEDAERIERLALEVSDEIARAGMKLIAMGRSASGHAVSFVVKRSHFHKVALAIHRRIQPVACAVACAQPSTARVQ